MATEQAAFIPVCNELLQILFQNVGELWYVYETPDVKQLNIFQSDKSKDINTGTIIYFKIMFYDNAPSLFIIKPGVN